MNLTEGIANLVAATPHDRKLLLAVGEVVTARVVNLLEDGRAVLGIKGKMITAATDVVLQKDAVAAFKVTDFSANEVKLQFQGYREAPKAGETSAPELTPGTVLRGVFTKNAEGAPVVVLPRGEVPVRTEVPLPPGTTVTVQVVEGEHGPELTLLRQSAPESGAQQVAAKGPEFLPAGEAGKQPLLPKIPAAFEEVTTKMRALGLDAKPLEEVVKNFPHVADLTPAALKQALEKGGVLLETKLRKALRTPDQATGVVDDLKGRLLQAAKVLERASAEGKDVVEAKKAVEGLLQQVEDFQLLSAAENSLRTFLPLAWPGLQDGDLEFRKTPDGEASSCRVNLDFAEQGTLAIMILFARGGFSVYLRPEKEAFAKVLAANTDRLREMFGGSGLSLRSVDVVGRESRAVEQIEASMSGSGVTVSC